MPNDVVPALNEEITLKFQNNMMRDRRAARVIKRIQNGTAILEDGHEYAQSVGECLSNALQTTLTEENLPDGKMYFNIADRTVKPALMVNYDLVNNTASDIQLIIDNGIGLKSVKAAFPDGRINGLIDKICDSGLMWLGEAIINNSEAFFDDYVKANAAARSEAGLAVQIVRTAAPGCCKWCDGKVGTYSYDRAELDAMDIFARHEFCRCSVTYKNGKSRQNVWSKAKWEATPEELKQRKDIRGRPTMTERERIEAIATLDKDRYFQALRDVGYTDNDADRIYDKALRQKAKNAGFDIQKYIFERIRAKRIETLGG